MQPTQNMAESLDFDPDFYFGLVADNLIKNFGSRALYYADEALRKMRAIGDDEGFELWMSIHEHLNQRAADAMTTKGVFAEFAEDEPATLH